MKRNIRFAALKALVTLGVNAKVLATVIEAKRTDSVTLKF